MLQSGCTTINNSAHQKHFVVLRSAAEQHTEHADTVKYCTYYTLIFSTAKLNNIRNSCGNYCAAYCYQIELCNLLQR